MPIISTRKRRAARKSAGISATAALLILITGCAGSAGDSNDRGTSGGGTGFEYGATQKEVDAAIEELDSVELVYQPHAQGPDTTSALSAELFKEQIETRSNGKITIDITWGQAIASYAEIDDALADGRVDIAHSIPPYSPEEYPAYNAMSYVTQLTPSSPLVGEMVRTAMMTELGWNSESVLSELRDKGLTVLSPLSSTGENYFACAPNVTGTEEKDWPGRQIRIGTPANLQAVEVLGASPVSLEYGEAYEALQRSTIDCTLTPFSAAASMGLIKVAPNIGYLSDHSFAGTATSAHVAGSSFHNLPLAYQQIIFDADAEMSHGWLKHLLDSAEIAISDANATDGKIEPIGDQAQQLIEDRQSVMLDEEVAAGRLPEDIEEQANGAMERWSGVASELGYSDGGELSNMDEWYAPGDVDFLPFTERMYEEIALPHRPN